MRSGWKVDKTEPPADGAWDAARDPAEAPSGLRVEAPPHLPAAFQNCRGPWLLSDFCSSPF